VQPHYAIEKNTSVESHESNSHTNAGPSRRREKCGDAGGKQVDRETDSPKASDCGELQDDKILQLRVTGVDECALRETEKIFRPHHCQGKSEGGQPEVTLPQQSAIERHSEGEPGCRNEDRDQREPERELDDLMQIVPEVQRTGESTRS
jgi:hypothetical protein